MHLLDLIERELRAYRKSRRTIHLAHAARALDEVRAELRREPKGSLDVDGHHRGGQ